MQKVLLVSVSLISLMLGADGSLDTTFGGSAGYVTLPTGFFASGVAVQPDDRIVVAGSDANNNFQLVRYNTDGTLDMSFGASFNGIATGPIGLLFDVLIQPDGYILTGGQDNNGNFQLARFYPQGFIDSSFGVNGVVVGPSGFCSALAQEQDSSVIAGGANNAGQFFVMRYDSYGNINTSFDFGPDGYIEDLVIQPDGKAVACGVDNDANFSIVRYNTDGSIDTSFGINGVTTGPQGVATALVIQSDGYIVVAGFDLSDPNNMLLARYDTNGNVDASFGTNGIVEGPTGIINGMSLQADGKIIVVGENDINTLLARFNANGTLDITFGIDGITSTPTGIFYGVGFQSDGKTVAVGLDDSSSNFLVARYTNNQTLTPTQVTYPVVTGIGYATIYGTAQNPSEVFIFLDGQLLGGTSTNSNGDNTWDYTIDLSTPGMYSLRAVSVYKAGNIVSAGSERLRIYG